MTIWKGNWIIGGLTVGARPSYIEIPNCIVHSLTRSLTHCCAWPAEGRSYLHNERYRVTNWQALMGWPICSSTCWSQVHCVDGPEGASSQWQEVYRWRHQRMQCIVQNIKFLREKQGHKKTPWAFPGFHICQRQRSLRVRPSGWIWGVERRELGEGYDRG